MEGDGGVGGRGVRGMGTFAGRGLDAGGMGAFAGKGLGLEVGGKDVFAGVGLGLGVGGMGAGRGVGTSSQTSKSQSKVTTWLMAGLGSAAVEASSFFIWRLPMMCTL
jgi:hypothetical protein